MGSSKLPSIQFYPGDWKKDPGILALNYYDRGVWFEILLMMFESTERGRLLLNGKPMPDAVLANVLGIHLVNQKSTTMDNQILNTDLTSVLNRLLDYGVADRDQDGALINRRMIRDEEIRQIRKKCGSLGGNPNLVNQKSTTMDKQIPSTMLKVFPTPSASASKEEDTVCVDTQTRTPTANGEKAAATKTTDPLSSPKDETARWLAKVCYGAATPESRSRFSGTQIVSIRAEAKRINSECAPSRLEDWYEWYLNNWRGKSDKKNGSRPSLSSIRNTWSEAFPDEGAELENDEDQYYGAAIR